MYMIRGNQWLVRIVARRLCGGGEPYVRLG
jgi:hypothetical protein